ncbi:glycosyltransferase family 2 protein [Glaciecola sp. MF2-115]|uniref:glycosyltransferase family 2 protein n=1 Tax=Glaciecola sp. MF2-115 TaxID=3384827 RepID=UPI00399F3492
MNINNPFFSIVVATRNRPKLLKRAIQSLIEQKVDANFTFEIIVIDDGSDEDNQMKTEHFLNSLDNKVVYKKLEQRTNGHGPSFARNEGIALSSGQFICFLDDDDVWVRKSHLSEAYNSLLNKSTEFCIFLSKQNAITPEGNSVKSIVWNEDLADTLSLDAGVFEISLKQILRSNGFNHLNTLIASKSLIVSISGFNESLRYEEDRNFYTKLIDKADYIFFNNHFIAKHYIPNKKLSQNASTTVNKMDKLLQQITSHMNLLQTCKHEAVIYKVTEQLCDIFKRCHDIQISNCNIKLAAFYASLAASVKFDMRWFLYALYLKIKSRI